jgi:hypothetical protein
MNIKWKPLNNFKVSSIFAQNITFSCFMLHFHVFIFHVSFSCFIFHVSYSCFKFRYQALNLINHTFDSDEVKHVVT